MPEQTVKRLDGSDTWCTLDEHIYRHGAELAGANLRGLSLRRVDLTGACLDGADLSGARLEHVNLGGARLRGTRAVDASFTHVLFPRSRLQDAVFERCTFEDSDFRESIIVGGGFLECTMPDTSFRGAGCRGVDFGRSDLSGSVFSHNGGLFCGLRKGFGTIRDCSFDRANLSRAVFGRSMLAPTSMLEPDYVSSILCMGSSFREAKLEHACFDQSRVKSCIFDGADLTGASFAHALIRGRNSFQDTKLMTADFTKAWLFHADLRTCNLINARFHGAVLPFVSFPPGFCIP